MSVFQEKISVIVPVYNTAIYLDRCIGSILKQSHQNLEVIIINDGSVDSSGDLCDALAIQDPRIRVIHKTNMGVSAARNDGLDAATGDYIAFVDSDDVIASHMLETLHDLITRHGADMAACGYMCISSQSECWKVGNADMRGTLSKQEALQDFISDHGFRGFLCNKLFRRDLFQEPIPLRLDEDIHFCEDLLITCQLVERAELVAYTKEKLYGYVVLSQKQTVTEKTLTSLIARKRMIEIYSRNGLSDGKSRYAYAVAVMLTYCNSAAVNAYFEELQRCFQECRWMFEPQLHSLKERLVFRLVSIAPRLFPRLYGEIRNLRRVLWKKKY